MDCLCGGWTRPTRQDQVAQYVPLLSGKCRKNSAPVNVLHDRPSQPSSSQFGCYG